MKTDPADAKPSGPAAEPSTPTPAKPKPSTVQSKPVQSKPVQSKPVKVSPVKVSPAKTGAAKTGAVQSKPAKTGPAKTGGAPPEVSLGTETGDAAAAAVRWALLLAVAALGVVVGTVGSFAHRATATALGVAWPTGLFFAFCGLLGLLLGLGELLGVGPPRSWRPTRLSAVTLASAGWLLALLWLTYLGPPPTGARKGDVILANDWRSLAFLFGGMLLATTAVYRAWVANLAARLAAHSKG